MSGASAAGPCRRERRRTMAAPAHPAAPEQPSRPWCCDQPARSLLWERGPSPCSPCKPSRNALPAHATLADVSPLLAKAASRKSAAPKVVCQSPPGIPPILPRPQVPAERVSARSGACKPSRTRLRTPEPLKVSVEVPPQPIPAAPSGGCPEQRWRSSPWHPAGMRLLVPIVRWRGRQGRCRCCLCAWSSAGGRRRNHACLPHPRLLLASLEPRSKHAQAL